MEGLDRQKPQHADVVERCRIKRSTACTRARAVSPAAAAAAAALAVADAASMMTGGVQEQNAVFILER